MPAPRQRDQSLRVLREERHPTGGLDLERLKTQWEEIARVQETVSVRLLRGTESDILADGSEKAQELAPDTMRDVREAMGLTFG